MAAVNLIVKTDISVFILRFVKIKCLPFPSKSKEVSESALQNAQHNISKE